MTDPPAPANPLWSLVALHEAAHAVVGVHVGLTVRQITIEPVNGNVAGTEFGDDPRPLAIALRARAVALVAGPLAQTRATGVTEWERGWAGDLEGIQGAWLGLTLFAGAAAWEEFFDGIQREAGRLLSASGRAVTAVAEALLRARRLSGERAHAIIDVHPLENGADA